LLCTGNVWIQKYSHDFLFLRKSCTENDIASCQGFLQQLHEIGRCFDYRGKTFKNCEFVKKLSKDDIFCDGSTFLVALENQENPLRDTHLKGMMAAANQNQVTKSTTEENVLASWSTCSAATDWANLITSSHSARN
jgi:hypothetical protein